MRQWWPLAFSRTGGLSRSSIALRSLVASAWARTQKKLPWAPVRNFGSLLLLTWWVLSGLSAHAQRYTFAQFGQSDGLLNGNVSVIAQDRRGVLWVGTENGVFLIDGSHFDKVESFQDAVAGAVLAIQVDSLGRVWVLGSKRLVYFTEDHAVHPVSSVELSLLFDDNVALASLPGDADSVYLLLNGKLQRVQSRDGGLTWHVHQVSDGANAVPPPVWGALSGLAADPRRGVFWTGCGERLCEVRPPSRRTAESTASVTVWDTKRGIPPKQWTRLLVARDGALWARGGGELLRLNPRTSAVQMYSDPAGDAKAHVHCRLAEDADGSVVVNLLDGLARLQDGHWEKFTAGNGLPPSQIQAMFFDRRGDFWLAPVGGGIWRWLGYRNWEGWTRSEGLNGSLTWGMLRDNKGQMWAAAADNLVRIDESHGKAFPQHSGVSMSDVVTLAKDVRGHIWGGTVNGTVLDFNPATEQARRLPDSLGSVYRVFQEAGSARIWICSAKGIGFVTDKDGWRAVSMVRESAAPQANVWSVTQDAAGALWFSAKGGLYRFAGGRWTQIRLPPQVEEIDYPELSAAPDGTLWMQAAMPTPLLQLRVSGATARVVKAIPGELIGSDAISFIRFDRRGWLWVGTDIGVYVWNGQRWVHCTQEDGLLSDDTDMGAVLPDVDGSMWFGTVGGISHLLDPQKLFQVPRPEISVRDVRLNGTELQAGGHPQLDFRNPELSISLFSTDYTRPRAIVFRYKLRGLIDNWQTSVSGNLHFSGLPPGEYVLSIQAMDTRLHAVSAPINYAFTVLPPWYRRDRAKVLGLVVLLAIGMGWWRLSLRRLKASEATLKAKVDQQTAQLLAEKEQLERAQRELVESSRRDALTGLLNRSAIFEVLGAMRRVSLENGMPLSVIMADLDHFKSVNDRYGHTVGDAVLRECADRLRQTLRPGDAVGRYGGEEVLLVIPGLSPSHAAARLEELRHAIASRPIAHGEHSIHVTCSFGVAWLDGRHREVESIVNAADAALYLAKQSGRNRVEFAPDEFADEDGEPAQFDATELPAEEVETK